MKLLTVILEKICGYTDQSYQRNDFECIQGVVTLYDVEEGDATLKVLEGSNKYHGEYWEYRRKVRGCPREDWFRLKMMS